MSSGTIAANRMNLAALQRVDSAVTEIIDNASQVALYKFAQGTNGWEKTDVEGALFIFEWSKTPSHGLFVINRLSTTNLLEVITQDVQFETQSPFLLYKTDSGIHCIWFYDTEECERVGRLCQSLASTGRMSSRSKYRQRCASESDSLHQASLAAPTAPQNGATKDIVALLSKAREQYNMKKAEASPSGHKQLRNPARARSSRTFVSSTATAAAAASAARPGAMSNGHATVPSPPSVLHKPTPLRTTNGIVPAVVSTEVPPSTPLTVESLFAAVGHQEPEVVRGEEEAKQALLRVLLANPDNRVEHVERIQRSQDARAGEGVCDQPRLRAASCQASMSAWEVSDKLRHRLNLGPPSATEDSPPLLPLVVTPAMLELGLSNGERRSPPAAVILSDQLPFSWEPSKGNTFSSHVQAPAASDLPLLTPMAFTKWAGGVASAAPSLSSSSTSSTLGPCMNGEAVPCSRGEPVGALTKDQLKDALIHMLQTDDSFLVKLHEAYVGSLKSRFNLEARNNSSPSMSYS